MPEPLFDVYDASCPSRTALHRIGDRWTALVVGVLAERPHRFGELRRRIGGVSQKMLTQTLRSLERDGLVSRKAFATVPVTVEYSLTALGETIVPVLAGVRDWAEERVAEVIAARERFDARADGAAGTRRAFATKKAP
jgi:DNA-binding HxlR family transcriptional regulator